MENDSSYCINITSATEKMLIYKAESVLSSIFIPSSPLLGNQPCDFKLH